MRTNSQQGLLVDIITGVRWRLSWLAASSILLLGIGIINEALTIPAMLVTLAVRCQPPGETNGEEHGPFSSCMGTHASERRSKCQTKTGYRK